LLIADKKRSETISWFFRISSGLAVLGGLALLGTWNYLIFHSMAELFSVIVAAAVFVIAWNVRDTIENGYLLFLGIAFLFVAAIDLIHMLAFKGMGAFPGFGTNLPTQLWIAGRGLEAISLLIAPVYLSKRVRPLATFAVYAFLYAFVLASIFLWQIFPACYVEGSGLTPFKIVSEYMICLILLLAMTGLLSCRRSFLRPVLLLLCCSIVATILSELAFTKYASVYGDFNMIGHLLKIIAVIFIYKAIVETGFRRPYELLYRSLAESEQKFRSVVDSNMIGVVFGDPITGAVHEANDEYLRIVGRTRADLQAGKINWKAITPTDLLAREEEAIAARDPDEKNVHSFEKEYIRLDGMHVPVIIGGAFLDNTRRRMVAYVLDNTIRKRMEDDLKQSRRDLELRVQERTKELSQTVQELHERSEQLRHMTVELTMAEQRERKRLSQVLHDGLQQILVAVKIRLALVEHSPNIGQATDQVTNLIDEAIQISRSLTAELSPPILLHGDFLSALEWLVYWMRDKHGLDVNLIAPAREKIDSPGEEVVILLFHATRELLFNVVKHAKAKSVQVEVGQVDDQITVSVQDDGTGFDPSRLRMEGGNSGGLGLLSIAERLSYIGGRMDIDSTPGRGSRCNLVSPKFAAVRKQVPGKPPVQDSSVSSPIEPRPSGGKNIRIMLADDHPIIRQGLAGLLSQASDFELAGEAADGESAINLVRQIRPDVVLMDIGMPGMDGIQATRIIHREFPEIPIIGLSMFQEEEQETAMIAAGAVDYRQKSGPAEVLLEAIRDCVNLPADQKNKAELKSKHHSAG
jgi:PAS domain S-box-containing protein